MNLSSHAYLLFTDSLLSLKKSQLLTSLDVEHGTDHEEKGSHDLSGNDEKPDSAHLDDEYAAFQVGNIHVYVWNFKSSLV